MTSRKYVCKCASALEHVFTHMHVRMRSFTNLDTQHTAHTHSTHTYMYCVFAGNLQTD